MTTWDKIYKNYEKGGEAWATLSEEIHPLFKQFLSQEEFPQKAVLDIGCGTGKYLKYLQAHGFQTDGIDSSETAVKMTKQLLDDTSNIQQIDMYDYKIKKDTYDLIISISTIHHGTKEQVSTLINQTREALIENGKAFITLPDFENTKKWETFKNHKKLAEGTYAPMKGPEKGLPHSFFTKEEVQKLFEQYSNVRMDLDEIGRWIIQAKK